ncbi:iron-containing alcohol dehydrogenase [Methanogenium organophilum]|uniref:Iron-containing alcohol dehydrogenase n=1 Tax=Methanogenium organophilum TaxID=2199 RepID=A0A9X9T7V5_METOG|nr:iron-containing alcohol dehydrogenase [Methanogenium organophilum]WAI00492.1 iron-containing alcohol dehydrogenase [Methanogenium organophilum]
MVYTFYNPKVALMGAGCVREIGNQATQLGGTKALIVCGVSKHGKELAENIAALLKGSDVASAVFAGAEPNPTDTSVQAGAEMYARESCDLIVAVGGGSPMDCAKGIGILATNGGEIRDYEGTGHTLKPLPPLITVNTTAGTASEMTSFSIITDTKRHIKMALVDWRLTPDVAINDPELMVSMPSSLTAATGMDALTHAVEAFVSTIATPVTDAAALKSIELVATYLPRAVSEGTDMEAREMMAYAEYLAGIAFNNASLGYVHAMAHQLGGFYNLPHGVCNAILLPHVGSFNKEAVPQRFAIIGRAMGVDVTGMSTEEAAEASIGAIKELAAAIGIPSGLAEIGAKEEDLPVLAENAMKDVCGLTNPREADLDEIIAIYRSAM